MTYTATITSKRQLTIPSELFKEMGFKEGEKVVLEKKSSGVYIRSSVGLVNELAGSFKVSKEFQGVSEDEIIVTAKKEYFNKMKS